MTDNDLKVDNAAINMIDRYGENALQEADLRILELQSRNELEALHLWRKIRSRITYLSKQQSKN